MTDPKSKFTPTTAHLSASSAAIGAIAPVSTGSFSNSVARDSILVAKSAPASGAAVVLISLARFAVSSSERSRFSGLVRLTSDSQALASASESPPNTLAQPVSNNVEARTRAMGLMRRLGSFSGSGLIVQAGSRDSLHKSQVVALSKHNLELSPQGSPRSKHSVSSQRAC